MTILLPGPFPQPSEFKFTITLYSDTHSAQHVVSAPSSLRYTERAEFIPFHINLGSNIVKINGISVCSFVASLYGTLHYRLERHSIS